MLALTAPQRNVIETDKFFKNTSISNIKRSVLNLKQKDFSTLLLALLNN